MSRFSEADKDFDPTKLTPEQRRTYEASRAAEDPNYQPDEETKKALGIETIRAAYKIEIMFGPDRTVNGPNMCCIQCWESGKRLHGGGDELVYWCKDTETDDGCWGPIIGDRISGRVAFCENCERMVSSERLTGQRFMRIPTKKLAEHVAKIWRQLGMNADIYCKYDLKDIRVQAMEKKLGSAEAHKLRGLFIYPLKNILKDTAAGAALEARFEAFFKA